MVCYLECVNIESQALTLSKHEIFQSAKKMDRLNTDINQYDKKCINSTVR